MLTKNQRRALLLIEAEVEFRELADQLGYKSQTTARNLLLGLERRGFIRRMEGQDRAIEVLRPVSRFAAFRFDARTKALQHFPKGKRA